MVEYPLTPEQKQEALERATRTLTRRPDLEVHYAASLLHFFVFKDGRLSNTMSGKTRLKIAQEALDTLERIK